ncbi:hypothetical protein AVEN_170516-1 [Araneus ventricosus]|uniref:ATP-dependent DNA helicase n=1 Tax=Araneus ventricosus TaxID=182803 RepID=A0A4Y2BZB3_ARAVE|nr:hypothetical protein AVEN_170516-1 [Araneus ventricosus]
MRPASADAQQLSKLIIIDEITMLTKDGLLCIDILLKEIMNNAKPFRGKVIVIGGDFRQTLTVQRGTRVEVIESCIKSSPLWPVFTRLSLTENMRSCRENQHNEWLLNVENESLPQIETLFHDYVEIPHRMIEGDN